MKKSFVCIIIFFAAACAKGWTQQNNERASRPNIVWISAEDASPRWGCYGDKTAQTPNIDKLAEEGSRFTNVHTTAAICAPVRSGIITGMYQTSIGCMHMRTVSYRRSADHPLPYTAVPPHYVKAFTEYLRASGYYCTNNSKTDYQFAANPVPASIWDECSKEADFSHRRDKDQPFFSVYNFEGTHESQNWKINNLKTDPSAVTVPPYYPDTDTVRRTLARVYDNIARFDKFVGDIVARLEREGVADNTIIFCWNDHGDGLPRAKRWLYNSGTHIPLVIRWPGKLKPGSVDDRLISSIDFGPTVLSMAGVETPAHMQGRPFLGSQTGEKREYLFAARDRVDESYDMVRSVRNEKFLYIRNYYPNQPYFIWAPYRNRMPMMQEMQRLHAEGKLAENQERWFSGGRPAEELYDLRKDYHNMNNLADDPRHSKTLASMRSVLDQWMRESGDLGLMNESEMIEQMWPGGKQPVTDQPYFVVNAAEDRSVKNRREGGRYSYPAMLSFYNPTQGASMVYTLDEGEDATWLLYAGPIRLEKGKSAVRVRSFRYGYQEGPELKGIFEIN